MCSYARRCACARAGSDRGAMRSPYKCTTDRTAAHSRGCGPLASGSLTTDRSIWWQRRCRRSHRRGRTPRSNGCCCKSRSSTAARSRRLQHSTTCGNGAQLYALKRTAQHSTAHTRAHARAAPLQPRKPCAEAATDSTAAPKASDACSGLCACIRPVCMAELARGRSNCTAEPAS